MTERDIELENLSHAVDRSSSPSANEANTTQRRHLSSVSPERMRPASSDPRRNDRTVFRELRSIHIFMITISGILGVGLYVRSGEVLRLGGPAAVLSSFAVLGFIAWAVMQCIAEMLCIWPVPGALVEFVSAFVDDELGLVVGVAYWFTYAINLSALITATAIEAHLFKPVASIEAIVLFCIMPAILFAINSLGVALYGLIEVIRGAVKIALCLAIFFMMIAINAGAGPGQTSIGSNNFHETIEVNRDVAYNWASAFFMSLSIAAFQFIGVEIPAATALEARKSSKPQPDDDSFIEREIPPEATLAKRMSSRWQTLNNTSGGRMASFTPRGPATEALQFSATKLPIIAGVTYFVSGLLVCLNVEWNNESLPITWTASSSTKILSNSAFVIAAEQSGIPGLGGAITVFMMFTALTAANTALYVASRTLFSLTRELPPEAEEWYIRLIANCGRTNRRGVPLTAICVSCCFLWLPFLYFIGGDNQVEAKPVANLLDVLAQMGSVSCIVVWACECYAFIRFWKYLHLHNEDLKQQKARYLIRSNYEGDGELYGYPYRSTGQPLTAYLALTACLFILVVANGATLWRGIPHISGTSRSDSVGTFLAKCFAAYLAPICFILLWVALKFYRYGGRDTRTWKPKNLSKFGDFKKATSRLDRLRDEPIRV